MLQHPKLLEFNIFQNFTINEPFLLTYPQFINSPCWVKGNKIQNPRQLFQHLATSSFHNCMHGPSLGLHKMSIGNTLYCIIGHLTLSTKNQNKCMSIWLTRTFRPLFKYPKFETRDFLNELWNEWMILGKHECFHQIRHDIIILFFQLLKQISNFFFHIFMCVPNYKKPQLNFFKNFSSILQGIKHQQVTIFCYLLHNCPCEEVASLAIASHLQFVYMLQCIQTIRTYLHDLLEECILQFKLKQNPWLLNWFLSKAMKQVQKWPNCEIKNWAKVH